jgi:hypothetical protein
MSRFKDGHRSSMSSLVSGVNGRAKSESGEQTMDYEPGIIPSSKFFRAGNITPARLISKCGESMRGGS